MATRKLVKTTKVKPQPEEEKIPEPVKEEVAIADENNDTPDFVEENPEIPEQSVDPEESPTEPYSAEDSPQDVKNQKLFTLGIVSLLLVVFLSIGGIFFYLIKISSLGGNRATPSPMPKTPPPVVEQETKVELNRADWQFEVLNGSGVPGAAKKIAKKLEVLGYKVVKTGNADNQSYPTTQLFVSESMTDQAELLLADLNSELNIASVSGELKDSTASARIVIGKE
jgi:hypothetical protein